MTDPRTQLPAVSALLERPEVKRAVDVHGHDAVTHELRRVLAAARAEVDLHREVPSPPRLVHEALRRLASQDRRRLRPVINATGVLLHTNLGRAVLSDEARSAMLDAAGPTNLELDLADGRRGGRGEVAHRGLARLCGAAAAIAVNNGAAALVLALAVTARDREVVIGRGELVEIGGSFRLPAMIEAAGARLREVGTTNRTRVQDYADALTTNTGAVLRVHPSNYRIDGFTARPTTAELARLAQANDLPLIEDIGSGLLAADPGGGGRTSMVGRALADEPVAAEVLDDGADLIIFSGDKLLGGPQAGVLAGSSELVERCRRHPLARAMRLDKLRLAALESTVLAHERGAIATLPLWRLARAQIDELEVRARTLAEACGGSAVPTDAVLGGGSTPGNALPSWGVALPGDAEALAATLRGGDPPVLPRITDDRLLLDLRAVPPEQDDELRDAVCAAVGMQA